MSLESVNAVIFDLDGTLVDSERDNVESVVLAMQRLGFAMSQPERDFVIGHAWTEIYDMLVHNHGMDRDAVPMARMIALAVEEKQGILRRNRVKALPGARALVTRLSPRMPLAIASGSSKREVSDMVSALELDAHFRVLVGAEDCTHGKPDPEPYRLAMQKLAVGPGGCVVIEDAPPGILSGKAAGAAVVAVQAGNYAGFDLSAADVVVASLLDVTDELLSDLVRSRAL